MTFYTHTMLPREPLPRPSMLQTTDEENHIAATFLKHHTPTPSVSPFYEAAFFLHPKPRTD
jgi:hypothetical protein